MFGMTKEIVVADNQRTFMYRDRQFEQVLEPGKHKIWRGFAEISCKTFDLSDVYFNEPLGHNLVVQHAAVAAQIHDWVLSNHEVGLVYVDNQLQNLVAPGERVMIFKAVGDVRLERIDLSENQIIDAKLMTEFRNAGMSKFNKLIGKRSGNAATAVLEVDVAQNRVAMLHIDGQFVKMLTPGHYGFWQLLHKVTVEPFDLKSQSMDVAGQEILTKDRVSLRLNLSANYKLVNVELAASSVADVREYVYKSLQLALREAVGTKTLDDLLIDKLYINETVKEVVAPELENMGVKLERVGVKDIILPGEMKDILNQVVEAQKTAEANVIRRREETSATRSLHNTAKLMENNPTLLRLKELEALEKVSERVNQINVYGGLDGLMNSTVKLV